MCRLKSTLKNTTFHEMNPIRLQFSRFYLKISGILAKLLSRAKGNNSGNIKFLRNEGAVSRSAFENDSLQNSSTHAAILCFSSDIFIPEKRIQDG